jgi:hypothetical protein
MRLIEEQGKALGPWRICGLKADLELPVPGEGWTVLSQAFAVAVMVFEPSSP